MSHSSTQSYTAVCHLSVPSTEHNPDFDPSVAKFLGVFSSYREAFNACREYADAHYAAFICFRVVRGGVQ